MKEKKYEVRTEDGTRIIPGIGPVENHGTFHYDSKRMTEIQSRQTPAGLQDLPTEELPINREYTP